ncbi:Zn-dependent hydrolase [Sporosarcina pasteurii]|uniref:Uncharacterized hydrolase HI_0588 n=1 Tax=Sporosarcina pasteurii TaxID=1474 RepID=A0A380C269_SPOPA|nr:Zn-dependent hydrolase [Sporosarcina pasteurii]MDS9471474.1 Zn-dependent hydrolase [Sporosarcina pasteurii]SUJ10478.1 Uncharacterized hydrolase HI_0588 [Sporosarcina pasteurii]
MITIENLLHWIQETLLQLNLTNDMNQPKGFSRLGYTKEEQDAHEQFRVIAQNLGLETHQDSAGNQWAVWKVDENASTIAAGSHLDTVYNGGGYDGVAGVLTAFAAVKILKAKQFKPVKNIAIVAFACEESARFGVSTIGSKAVCGLLNTDRVANLKDTNGITLQEAVNDSGLNWQDIQEAELATDAFEQFIEIHIEQGRLLEKTRKDIGIVRAIAQPTRLLITCEGMTNHTGTTPMNDRQDALVAIAGLISHVESAALQMNERQSIPVMATVSTIKASPNAMNMIPGQVVIGVDIRSTNADLKQEMVEVILSFIQHTEVKRSVTFHIETLADDPPIQLDINIQGVLAELCEELNLSSMIMDSGAGHDAMNMAKRWPSGLLFIPCRQGISHHPDEYTDSQSLLNGAKLLAAYFSKCNEAPSC